MNKRQKQNPEQRRILQPGAGCLVVTVASIVATALQGLSAQGASGSGQRSMRMADGRVWTTRNSEVNTASSYCYDNSDADCRRYGRLYTWEAARQACQSLGDGWRLPTDQEWRNLARHYGGVSEDSDERGKAAYKALSVGGSSGFDAVLGGGRDEQGRYERREAHGFYWTATEADPKTVWYYNFGRGGQAFHRQNGGEKKEAFSVRCVR